MHRTNRLKEIGAWQSGAGDDDLFWRGAVSGTAQSGQYTNWFPGEPNDGLTGEDFAVIRIDGEWMDGGNSTVAAYVIEWDASEVLSNYTFSLTDDAGGRFAIDGNTGEITVADGSLLDYESAISHNVTVEVTDAGGNTSSEVMSITIDNVVEPQQTVPVAQSIDEDTTLTFTSGTATELSVTDTVGTIDSRMRVSLSVNDGALNLSQTTGLTFVTGADGSGYFVIDGAESDINAALDGMTFTPDANFNGSVTLNVNSALAAELEGHYTFETGTVSGSNLDDQSAGTQYDGTLNGNAAIFNDPERGDVLSLDGAGDYVHFTGLMGQPANVTLSAWINASSVDTSGAVVISMGSTPALYLNPDGTLVGYYESGGNNNLIQSVESLVGTGWRHVAVSMDATNSTMTLLIDGVAVETVATVGSIDYDNFPDTYIGRAGDGLGGYDFDGMIDDARVYSRALTAEEIAGLASDQTQVTDNVGITVNAVNDAPILISEIEVVNHSFEAEVLAENATTNSVTGWTTTGNAGAWNPQTSNYPADAPNGVNVGFINTGGSLSQATSAIFAAGSDYELTVAVGDEVGAGDPDQWEIRLFAGSQLLGSASSVDVDPSDGTFADVTLRLTSDQLSGFAAHYGQNITIELFDGSTSDNVHFDNVRLVEYSSSVEADSTNYIEGGAATQLAADISVFDQELSTIDDFGGATLTFARDGGASSDDVFSSTGNLIFNAGTLELSSANIGTYSNSGGTLSLTFAAGTTNAQVNEVMQSITYTNSDTNPPASVVIDWALDDANSGSQGSGGNLVATGSTTVNITDVPNPAAVDVPGAQAVGEDFPLAFSSPGGNAITVDSGSSFDPIMTTTLSVTHGNLTLSSTTGITFLNGTSNGEAVLTISGLESDINAALDGMQYQSTLNFNGSDTLSITTGSAPATAVDLYARYEFSGGSLSDDSGNGYNGTTVGDPTLTTDSDRGDVMNFDGDDRIVVTNGTAGLAEEVTISAWVNLDAGQQESVFLSLGDEVYVILDPTNPSYGMGGRVGGFTSYSLDSGDRVAGTGWRHVALTLDDANNELRVYLDGELTRSSNYSGMEADWPTAISQDIIIGSLSDGSRAFVGSIDDVRVYDRALTQIEIIEILGDQGYDTDSTGITVNAVNDTPVITVPGTQTVAEETTTAISGLSITDVDAASGNLTTRLQVSNGVLNLSR